MGITLGGKNPVLAKNSRGAFANSTAGSRYIWDDEKKQLHGPYATDVIGQANIGGQRRVQVEAAATNQLVDVGTWTLRGTCVRTASQADPAGGTGAFKLEGLNTGNNDCRYQTLANTADATVAVSFFLKRISTSGVLWVQNTTDPANGEWTVDLSLLSDGWERITADHLAVTVTNAWVNNASGNAGVHWRANSGGPLDVFVWWPQQEEADYPSSPIAPNTTRSADEQKVHTPDAIEIAAGTSLVWRVRGGRSIPGAAPDVDTITDIAPGADGTFDLPQPSVLQRPHAVLDNGFPGFDFTNQRSILVGAGSDLISVGDEVTWLFAARFDDVNFASALGDLSAGFLNSGFYISTESTNNLWAVGYSVDDGGVTSPTIAFSDTASIHIFRLTLDATHIHLAIDGPSSEVESVCGGGAQSGQDSITLGSHINNGYPFNGVIFESVVLQNPTAEQITDTEEALADKYGVVLS